MPLGVAATDQTHYIYNSPITHPTLPPSPHPPSPHPLPLPLLPFPNGGEGMCCIIIAVRCWCVWRVRCFAGAVVGQCAATSVEGSTTRSTTTQWSPRTPSQVLPPPRRILHQPQRSRTQGLPHYGSLRRHPEHHPSHPQHAVVGTRYPPCHAGLNELDYTELTVLVEEEFKIEFPDDVAEKFKDVNDMVQYVARSFWAA